MTRRRRVLDIWPGFVDGLAALLMVVIFVLLLFSVGEFMLTDALVGRDEALDRLRQNITELADVLAVERSEKTRLQERLTQMSSDLRETSQARDTARTQLQRMTAQAQAAEAETRRVRDALLVARSALANSEESLRAERDKIAGLETDVATLRTSGEELAAEKQRLQVSLAASQQETAEQTELDKQAQAQVNELNLQIVALREQLAQVTQALDASEAQVREQVVEIENLGQRLNVALANKVEELNRYRSEFFGKLREALKDNPDVHVEGDRFVLPSEVLFASASADLDAGGRRQVQTVAQTLKEISAGIPDDIDWVLRVDGHTDKRPIRTTFASNWELSSARAISIVKYMIELGIPPRRLVAAGFGKYHPLDTADTPEAYRRNRRIELKLSSR
jgi:chemotaxis protein MotB